uniref:Transposase n=1 Tax=Haemonchus contortus TaxID=6289 RepID=A0A7I4YWQ2_HAECO
MREARLRWYGHVLRADEESVRKMGLSPDVYGKRHRGRPKQRWLDTLHEDLKTVNIYPDQAFNREKWRQHVNRGLTLTRLHHQGLRLNEGSSSVNINCDKT